MLVRDRLWFNEANESRYFLVPGLVVLVMTLIGALLTALVVARQRANEMGLIGVGARSKERIELCRLIKSLR